jgi:hypothetical protein
MNTLSILSLSAAALNWSDRGDRMSAREVIGEAVSAGYSICKHADPTEGERNDIDADDAIEIAGIDQSLIYFVRA